MNSLRLFHVQIEITAKRNEIIDQSSLIARYQQEIQLLRGQLEIVMREREWPCFIQSLSHASLPWPSSLNTILLWKC